MACRDGGREVKTSPGAMAWHSKHHKPMNDCSEDTPYGLHSSVYNRDSESIRTVNSGPSSELLD